MFLLVYLLLFILLTIMSTISIHKNSHEAIISLQCKKEMNKEMKVVISREATYLIAPRVNKWHVFRCSQSNIILKPMKQ